MYTYLRNTNSKAALTEQLREKLVVELKKMRIAGDILEFSSDKELEDVLSKIDKSKTNTLVVIGSDEDLEMLVGQLGKINEDLAIGYLPLSESRIARALNIKDWIGGVQALAQRKIVEIPIFSVGSRYFLVKITLKFEKNRKDLPINVVTEGKLSLNLPESTLTIENSTDDNYHVKRPLLLTAEKPNLQPDTSQGAIIKLIKTKTFHRNSSNSEQILHLPIRAARISSDGLMTDSLGRTYRNSVIVGKNSKKIRLISKKSTRS